MLRRSRETVFLLLLASLIFRLVFVGHDMSELVTRGPLYDDSFYCFGIARNIAEGFGSTFDGEHPTNGYQPLYVSLLVPLYWLTGGHPTVPIYLALVISAILNVLTGLILFRLVRRFASAEAAIFGLVLWGFGPAIVRQAVNGLETSLAMLLIAASLEYYVTVYRPDPRPGARQAVTLGLLLGFAALARVDSALFGMALALDALWTRRRARAMRPLVLAGAVASVVLLPWCIASTALVGGVVPESGEATRFLSEAYAPHDVPVLAQYSFEDGPPVQLLVHNVGRSVMLLGTSPVVHIFTRGLERILGRAHLDREATLYTIASFLLFLVLVVVYIGRRQRRRGSRLPSDFNFLFGYSVLLVAAYSLVIFGQIFYSRYYYPIFFFSILLGAFAFELLLSLVGRDRPGHRHFVATTIVVVYLVILPYMSWNRLQNGNYQFLHVVDWIAAQTPRDATIGVFNSGAIGYFSNRRVLNLDGKVNPDALAALKSGRIRGYVAAEGIDYIIDHEWILERFLLDGGGGGGVTFTLIADGSTLGVPGWRAYRVGAAGGSSATLALPITEH